MSGSHKALQVIDTRGSSTSQSPARRDNEQPNGEEGKRVRRTGVVQPGRVDQGGGRISITPKSLSRQVEARCDGRPGSHQRGGGGKESVGDEPEAPFAHAASNRLAVVQMQDAVVSAVAGQASASGSLRPLSNCRALNSDIAYCTYIAYITRSFSAGGGGSWSWQAPRPCLWERESERIRDDEDKEGEEEEERQEEGRNLQKR
ncbi:hypothetical protein LZ30DRAFT_430716 [Colletotrichum cereale]|nr:hypothetical protein LZ30DRAFT_430716 [Colletotrichum cereale]